MGDSWRGPFDTPILISPTDCTSFISCVDFSPIEWPGLQLIVHLKAPIIYFQKLKDTNPLYDVESRSYSRLYARKANKSQRWRFAEGSSTMNSARLIREVVSASCRNRMDYFVDFTLRLREFHSIHSFYGSSRQPTERTYEHVHTHTHTYIALKRQRQRRVHRRRQQQLLHEALISR